MPNKFVAAATALTLVLFGSAGAFAQGASGNLGVSVELREEVRDSFIFVFFDDVAANEVRGRANRLARGQGGTVTHIYSTALKGFAAKMPADAAARLAAQNPNIDYYEPDGVVFAFPSRLGPVAVVRMTWPPAARRRRPGELRASAGREMARTLESPG